jgi:hypothetical protein
MPEQVTFAKAKLIELENDWKTPKAGGRAVEVQFNPETLKVTYQNEVKEQKGAGSQNDPPKLQFVGAGTTKLAVQLWFDVTGQAQDDPKAKADVRDLTKAVAYFMTPAKPPGKTHLLIPAVRFAWGSFSFEGVMDSLDETLEYFSPQGIPLRASMNFGMTRQDIVAFHGNEATASPITAALPRPGQAPLTVALAGESVQQMVARAASGSDWKAVASANGIENPRFVPAGTFVNLNPPRRGGNT